MATDLHVLACRTPGGTCIECMAVFRAVRKFLNAAVPVVEAETRAEVAEEIAVLIESVAAGAVKVSELTPDAGEWAYRHAADLARMRRMPDCGYEYHGADGGPCPRCGFDVTSPTDADPLEVPGG